LEQRPKLTRTTLPKFSGTPCSFQPFWNIFADAIHEHQDVRETKKFLYLLAQVKEPALLVIKHIELSATGYSEAIDLVKQNYDNPVLTTFSLYRRLTNIWSLITRANLKESTNKLQDIIRGIQKESKAHTNLESLITFLVVEGFNSELRQAHFSKNGRWQKIGARRANEIHVGSVPVFFGNWHKKAYLK
jgi:Protein of unknown function (DUF1759)